MLNFEKLRSDIRKAQEHKNSVEALLKLILDNREEAFEEGEELARLFGYDEGYVDGYNDGVEKI